MVLVIRAWVETGRDQGFRARLIQGDAPGDAAGPSVHVVTTSVDDTVRAVRSWLSTLDPTAPVANEESAER
jgi:hypothetical protein